MQLEGGGGGRGTWVVWDLSVENFDNRLLV